MSYIPSDAVTCEFTTQNPATGAALNADSLPVGTFARNGTDDGTVTVTVTNLDAGRYKSAFTIPSGGVAGDTCTLSIAATVSAIAGKAIVWQSVLDKKRIANIIGTDNLPKVSTDAQDLSSTFSVNAKNIAGQAAQLDASNFLKVDVADWLGSVPAALTANGYVQSMLLRWLTDNAGGTPDALSSGKMPSDLKLWLAVAPLALSSQQVQAIVSAYASGQAPLQPTVAGRTLDVSATGEGGVDWANVGSPTTTVGLSGTTIKAVTDAVSVGSITGDVAGKVLGGGASVITGDGVKAASVTGNVTGSVGSLATQAKADVNAEVVDALNVDTYPEPGQGAPPATLSIVGRLQYLYKFMRNKVTQTATTFSVFDDAGATVDQKAGTSDDTVTFTRDEIGSGP